MRRTPLYELHRSAGARFVEFAGWEMPVQYSGLIDEHLTVRAHAGIFDVSHMGELRVKGPKAASFLQSMVSNDITKLAKRQGQYALLLNDEGGVVDDIITYRLQDNEFFICVNAANAAADFEWLSGRKQDGVEILDESERYAQIALQGPEAPAILTDVTGMESRAVSADRFPYFSFREVKVPLGSDKWDMIIARTGYTGEDGFEIFMPPQAAPAFWERSLEAGLKYGAKPVGLGARDTLRLEVCYPLHGHELRPDVPALCANVAWAVKLQKGSFVGRDALLREKTQGLKLQLAGLELVSPGIARAEDGVFEDGQEVGWVTSGTKTPTLNKAVALAFVAGGIKAGSELEIAVRGKMLRARVVETPFLKPFSRR